VRARASITVFVGGCVAALAACGGNEGQRSCPSEFTCGALVTNTCGQDGACDASKSCGAAKKLQAEGDEDACVAAWCSLGESYKACE
jgi:hypothetical protein